MTGFVLAVVISGVIVCAFAALLAWRVVRRVRRFVAQGRRQAAEIRTRLLPPGPRRDAAMLRRRLADEVRSTHQVLTIAPGGRIFLADPVLVLADITTLAAALDEALASVQTFPDPAQQLGALAPIAPQVRLLIDTCYSARQTMLRSAALDRDRTLNSLSASVARQSAALATYEHVDRDLTI